MVPASVVTKVYANGSAAVRKQSIEYRESAPRPEVTTYAVYTYPDGTPMAPALVPHGAAPATERLALLFGRLQNTSVTRVDDGSVRIGGGRTDVPNGSVRLDAHALSGDTLTVGDVVLENVSQVEVVAVVGPDGVVRRYDLDAVGTLDGRRMSVDQSVFFTAIGTASTAPPEWYVRARLNQSVTFDPTNGTPAVDPRSGFAYSGA